MEEKLTLELFKELKAYGKRWFIIAIVELGVILAIVTGWFLMSYVIPAEDTTTSTEVEQQGDNGTNNYIGNDGDINNGKAKGNDD